MALSNQSDDSDILRLLIRQAQEKHLKLLQHQTKMEKMYISFIEDIIEAYTDDILVNEVRGEELVRLKETIKSQLKHQISFLTVLARRCLADHEETQIKLLKLRFTAGQKNQ